jgi:hypothetical protein
MMSRRRRRRVRQSSRRSCGLAVIVVQQSADAFSPADLGTGVAGPGARSTRSCRAPGGSSHHGSARRTPERSGVGGTPWCVLGVGARCAGQSLSPASADRAACGQPCLRPAPSRPWARAMGEGGVVGRQHPPKTGDGASRSPLRPRRGGTREIEVPSLKRRPGPRRRTVDCHEPDGQVAFTRT